MSRATDLDAVADACIAAYAVIADHGTPQMKMLIRVLLHIVGREIVQDLERRERADDETPEGSPERDTGA
jgi:hypothetical protein